MAEEGIHYKRSRFATRLFADRLYTSGHYWLKETEAGLWRIGFTKFATRMLGETVELGVDAKPGSEVAVGQVVGWIEGFKAVSDLYTPMAGRFEGANPALETEIQRVQKDPYGEGWLFAVRGTPDPQSVDVQGYVGVLDATIDKMLGRRHDG